MRIELIGASEALLAPVHVTVEKVDDAVVAPVVTLKVVGARERDIAEFALKIFLKMIRTGANEAARPRYLAVHTLFEWKNRLCRRILLAFVKTEPH